MLLCQQHVAGWSGTSVDVPSDSIACRWAIPPGVTLGDSPGGGRVSTLAWRALPRMYPAICCCDSSMSLNDPVMVPLGVARGDSPGGGRVSTLSWRALPQMYPAICCSDSSMSLDDPAMVRYRGGCTQRQHSMSLDDPAGSNSERLSRRRSSLDAFLEGSPAVARPRMYPATCCSDSSMSLDDPAMVLKTIAGSSRLVAWWSRNLCFGGACTNIVSIKIIAT
jgi:hypothetical protein